MIGIWQSYSDAYLIVASSSMLVFYSLPLLLVPLRWARLFRWEIPQPASLTVVLARSLGLFLSVLALFAFKAIASPAAKPFYFDFLIWLLAGMAAIHIYGAVRKTQPMAETIEILLWVVLLLLTLCFYPI